MLHPMIEKHRRGLNRFGRIISIMGWLLVILAGVWVSMKIGEYKSQPEKWSEWRHELLPVIMRTTSTFFIGLFSIGLGELIQFLLGRRQPGRLLRYGHIVLIVVAVSNILFSLWYAGMTLVYWVDFSQYESYVMIFLFPFYRLVYGVILVGLGLALRKVLPIVEESRTLA